MIFFGLGGTFSVREKGLTSNHGDLVGFHVVSCSMSRGVRRDQAEFAGSSAEKSHGKSRKDSA